jgi:hypothetical protein
MGARICIERGLGGIVVVIPVAVEVWMSSWWNDRGHVRSGRGSRTAVDCARSCPSHRRERVPRLGAPVRDGTRDSDYGGQTNMIIFF